MGHEVKWIKLDVDIFKDTKMQLLRSERKGEAYMLCWIQLLTLAGEYNQGGFIPISEKNLAKILRKKTDFVQIFTRLISEKPYELIEILNDGYMIVNWSKHQNEAKLAVIREYHTEAKRRERQAKKKKCQGQVHDIQDTDKDKDKDNTSTQVSSNTTTSNSNISEAKGEQPPVQCYSHYERNIGLMGGKVLANINSYLEDGLEDGLICAAIDEAVYYGKRNWAYINRILQRCVETNVKTVEQFRLKQAEHVENMRKGNYGKQKSGGAYRSKDQNRINAVKEVLRRIEEKEGASESENEGGYRIVDDDILF